MKCIKCNTEFEGNFCPVCGTRNEQSYNRYEENLKKVECIDNNFGALDLKDELKTKKYKKIIAITNIVLGAILFFLGPDTEYDWGLAPFFLSIGICLSGILQMLKNKEKVVSIIQIVMGGISALLSLDLIYDWEYIGFVAGVGMMVFGILKMTKRSEKVIAIVQVIFGGVTLFIGFACFEFAWGDTGLLVGVAFLVEGILNLVNLRQQK